MPEHHFILRQKLEETEKFVLQFGLVLSIIESSFREYSAQAEIIGTNKIKSGAFTLYYSPKRNAFSIKPFKNLPEDIANKIDNFLAQSASGTQEKPASHKQKYSSSPLRAFADGSYLCGKVGFGAVIEHNNEIIFEVFGGVNNPEYITARQVAGELFAVGKILQWCGANNVSEIDIFYDYAGIEAWATGKWKTLQPLTQNYANFVRSCGISVRWHKVAAHSGNKWNDYADALAKRGATES